MFYCCIRYSVLGFGFCENVNYKEGGEKEGIVSFFLVSVID